jgi:hypothetical protein
VGEQKKKAFVIWTDGYTIRLAADALFRTFFFSQ